MERMLYTVKEVAEILKTNTAYVYKLKDAGLLQFMKLGSLKCRKHTLEEFLAKYDGYDLTNPFDVKKLEDVAETAEATA